jgi:aminomethyltransferase
MVPFSGWEMPLRYTSIVEEHGATRSAAGIFDIGHMGRLEFRGPDAASFLDALVTRRVIDMQPGQIRYALVTNEEGGILDDVLVYCLGDDDRATFQWVVNAGNREKMLAWLGQQKVQHRGAPRATCAVELNDVTSATAMFAVQGPRAIEIVQPLVDANLQPMRYYRGTYVRIAGCGGYVSRTGYTGEDGVELIVAAGDAVRVWGAVMEAGASCGAMAAGLGCRDTLRLEAAMPLYGHELSETVNPVQAGLCFAVDLEGREFVGRTAILRYRDDAGLKRRVGLTLAGKRIAREGYPILRQGATIGQVTSGTYSPSLRYPIAMGYVPPDAACAGTRVEIDIRGKCEPATVVALPFYRRASGVMSK